jgi:hypothetical protein
MVYGRMGLEVESNNRVKFQPIPASTRRERIFKEMFGAGERKKSFKVFNKNPFLLIIQLLP